MVNPLKKSINSKEDAIKELEDFTKSSWFIKTVNNEEERRKRIEEWRQFLDNIYENNTLAEANDAARTFLAGIIIGTSLNAEPAASVKGHKKKLKT